MTHTHDHDYSDLRQLHTPRPSLGTPLSRKGGGGKISGRPLRIGIGGPVGSGKTALVERLCQAFSKVYSVGVVTNDIYTREDAEFLIRRNVLPAERIIGVETGACPHTAIREDASMNLSAIEDLKGRFPDLDIVFIESGGDNLAAAFSRELADLFLYVIDVAEGDKIPRKGGPGIQYSDGLIINKIDLAPYVGADLRVMERDSRKIRDGRPFFFTNLKSLEGVQGLVAWIKEHRAFSAIPSRKWSRQ